MEIKFAVAKNGGVDGVGLDVSLKMNMSIKYDGRNVCVAINKLKMSRYMTTKFFGLFDFLRINCSGQNFLENGFSRWENYLNRSWSRNSIDSMRAKYQDMAQSSVTLNTQGC